MQRKIGFTGSRIGMSLAQQEQLFVLLGLISSPQTWEFHHGDEPHADQEAERIAKSYGFQIVKHPPRLMNAKELLARNRDIVREVTLLIAAPKSDKEELRSGTWMTVREARKHGKPVVMLSRYEER